MCVCIRAAVTLYSAAEDYGDGLRLQRILEHVRVIGAGDVNAHSADQFTGSGIGNNADDKARLATFHGPRVLQGEATRPGPEGFQ